MQEMIKKQKVEIIPNGRRYLVQCEGFRGLAYKSFTGKWKSAAGDRDYPIVLK
jgi:hypothetical protein